MGINRPSILPLLLSLAEDEWHTLEIDMDTLDDDATTKAKGKDWPCYLVDIEMDETQHGEEEIPFWAMTSFADIYDALTSKQQKKVILLKYRRTKEGNVNTAEFKLA